VLGRLALAVLLFASSPVGAASALQIHATCATELARDPAHVRTLRGELTRALTGMRAPAGYTLDVSLVRLGTSATGRGLEVRAEVRAMLSDKHGVVRWSSLSRATARGTARDRALLQRDAVAYAARDLAKSATAALRTK
jgi:hypothetical protein